MTEIPKHDLIVTIVKKGCCERIVKAAKDAGAEGATIIPARGSGIHEQKKLMGIPIEPEKEVVLTIIQQHKTNKVLEAVKKAGRMNQPGTGVAFVVELKEVVGIVHLVKALGLDPDQQVEDKRKDQGC